MIFIRISDLILVTLIQRYDQKKSFHFLSNSRTRDLLKFYRLSEATFNDCISTIYQFIKPFLHNKMSIFETYVAFNDKYWQLAASAFPVIFHGGP